MKRLNKKDLKKLALLGLASGTVLSAQATAVEASEGLDLSQVLAYGCGANGCHGGNTAYRSTPQQQNYNYNGCNGQTSPSAQPQSGCAAKPQNSCSSKPQNGCGSKPTAYNARGYYNQQPQSSCAGMTQPTTPQPVQPTQPSSGCGGKNPAMGQTAYNQQGYYYNQQPQSSCAGMTQPTQPMQPSSGCGGNNPAQGQNPTAYNQGGNYFQPWSSTTPAQPQSGCSSAPQPATPAPKMPATMKTTPQGGTTAYAPRQNRGDFADNSKQDSSSTMASEQMAESDLMNQLNSQGKASYQSLNAAGKALALKLANQTCKGQNDCKGLNSCKSDKNTCAGKGSCKGQSVGSFKDKNLAVKVSAMKMAEKRAKASPKNV